MAKIYGILETMMHVLVFFKWILELPQQVSPVTTLAKISIQLAISSTKYINLNKELARYNICCFTKNSSGFFLTVMRNLKVVAFVAK
jgi:hypothetical protein